MENNKIVRLNYTEIQLQKIIASRVLIIGLGGVGGLVCETLVRSGIENFGICDGDKVEESNFNRQVIANDSTLGLSKVDACEKMMKLISRQINIKKYDFMIDENTINQIDFNNYDLIIDCIDDVKAKVLIIEKCKLLSKEIISSMGTANKTDPNSFKIIDINQTSYCPLAKKVRIELRKKQINNVKVCFSNQIPQENGILVSPMYIVGSASFVISQYAINYLINR